MNKTRRLFIGIPLSAPLRKRLAQEMAVYPKEAVLLTREENLHVTVLFLGFVHDEQVAEICARVEEACESLASFELSFTGMKLVDGEDHPKMIWLVGDANEGLKQVREALEKAFSSFVVEKKSYSPHVTLAKVKKHKWFNLPEKPVLKEKWHLMEMVDTVCVYESLSLDGKRRYEPIATIALLGN